MAEVCKCKCMLCVRLCNSVTANQKPVARPLKPKLAGARHGTKTKRKTETPISSDANNGK